MAAALVRNQLAHLGIPLPPRDKDQSQVVPEVPGSAPRPNAICIPLPQSEKDKEKDKDKDKDKEKDKDKDKEAPRFPR